MSKSALKNVLSSTLLILAVTVYSTFNNGCTKKSSSSPAAKDTLSSATIASTISSMVSSSSSGLGPQTENNASMYQSMGWTCGQIVDTNFSGSDTGGGLSITYNYIYNDTPFCTGSTLTKFDFYMSGTMDMSMSYTSGSTTTSVYMGSKMTTLMSMGGLAASSTNYTVNETCSATDTVKENSSSTNITAYLNMNVSSSNIVISKTTNMITSGTSNIQISYTSNGNSYNESATVTYTGNETAQITLSNGYTTTVTW